MNREPGRQTYNKQSPILHRAVILTALQIEYEAIRAHLTNIYEETHAQGTIYEVGDFASLGYGWKVAVVQTGMGSTQTARETERALHHFKPLVALFVGIAGGVKDVQLGDVVVATKVYGYESGKAESSGFKTRPEIGNSSHRLVQRAQAEARKADWLRRIKSPVPDSNPNVLIGAIASGEEVIASKRSAIYHFIRDNYNDTLAVEMEGFGFLGSTSASEQTAALVIRGISDLISGKRVSDKLGWQAIAARNASAFAFEMLAKLDANDQAISQDHALDAQPDDTQKLRSPLSELRKRRPALNTFHQSLSERQLMTRRERLQQQVIELKQDWNRITNRIEALRRDLAITTDSESIVTLEERLEPLLVKREQIGVELDELEQALGELTSKRVQHVFLSYKRDAQADQSLAMFLARYLNDRGVETFIDQKLTVGMDWVNEIHDQIAKSDFLVVLLSSASITSDMVFEEVKFADLQWRETGHPRTLPIRLAYEGQLPYRLDEYLRPLQYVMWTGDKDTPDIARRILNAMEGSESFDRFVESSPHTTLVRTISDKEANGKTLVAPFSEFDPRSILEAPGGLVDLESPFYISRHGDRSLERELNKSGSTTTIRAARQMGKTSLLVRGVEHARERGSPTVFFDFQLIDSTYLQDLSIFLRYVALNIASHLSISHETVDKVWTSSLGPKDRLTQFMEDHILRSVERPLVLAIDEADRLFDSAFRQEFFSMIRAWNTMRGTNPIWKKLNVAMVISTQPYLLIDDINQSPFNVGLRIELDDFTAEQVSDLNSRHGAPLNEIELEDMLSLLGGHPYLIRQAFYTVVDEDMRWKEFAEQASAESGPYSQHLRQILWHLRDKPDLIRTIRSVVNTRTSNEDVALARLAAAGIIRHISGNFYQCRCQLYEQYFRRCLS